MSFTKNDVDMDGSNAILSDLRNENLLPIINLFIILFTKNLELVIVLHYFYI